MYIDDTWILCLYLAVTLTHPTNSKLCSLLFGPGLAGPTDRWLSPVVLPPPARLWCLFLETYSFWWSKAPVPVSGYSLQQFATSILQEKQSVLQPSPRLFRLSPNDKAQLWNIVWRGSFFCETETSSLRLCDYTFLATQKIGFSVTLTKKLCTFKSANCLVWIS